MLRKWAIAILVGGLLMVSAPASAATFKWTRVGPSAVNFAQPGLARTADGILHMVWVQDTGSNSEDIHHTSISPDGVVGSTAPIQSGWVLIQARPDVEVAPDGSLRAMWDGARTTNPGETNTSVNTATAPSSGTPWTLQTGNVAEGSGEFGGGIAFTYAADGTPIEVSDGAWVHRGLSPSSSQDYDYQAALGGCCAYGGNIARDLASGEIFIVWYSNDNPVATPEEGDPGIHARQVDPATGAPAGAPLPMPGSTTIYNGREESHHPIARIPLVARVGGGLYTIYAGGYPNLNKVLVWKIGSPDSAAIVRGSDLADTVALAAAPDGRLWALWVLNNGGRPRIHASISNSAVTAWSPPVTMVVPGSLGEYVSLFEIDANATSDGIDVVVNLSDNLEDPEPGTSFWHVRLPEPPTWTTGNDTLAGTGGADFIYGGPGNDQLAGKGGSDDLYGGDGRDVLNGGTGKDLLNGGPGKDTCRVTKGDKIKSCEKVLGRRHL